MLASENASPLNDLNLNLNFNNNNVNNVEGGVLNENSNDSNATMKNRGTAARGGR